MPTARRNRVTAKYPTSHSTIGTATMSDAIAMPNGKSGYPRASHR